MAPTMDERAWVWWPDFGGHPAENLRVECGSQEDRSDFLKSKSTATPETYASPTGKNEDVANELQGRNSYGDLSVDERERVRSDIYLMREAINKLDQDEEGHGSRPGENAPQIQRRSGEKDESTFRIG